MRARASARHSGSRSRRRRSRVVGGVRDPVPGSEYIMNTIDDSQLMRKSMVRGDICGQNGTPAVAELAGERHDLAAKARARRRSATSVLVVLTTLASAQLDERISCCSPSGSPQVGHELHEPATRAERAPRRARACSAASARRLGTRRPARRCRRTTWRNRTRRRSTASSSTESSRRARRRWRPAPTLRRPSRTCAAPSGRSAAPRARRGRRRPGQSRYSG